MKYDILLFSYLTGLFLVGCSEKTPEDTVIGPSAYKLNVEVNAVSLGARQNLSSSFKVETLNTGWELANSERLPSWLSVSPVSGKETAVVTVSAQENISKNKSRSATINFRTTDTKQQMEKSVVVKQDSLGLYIITNANHYLLHPQSTHIMLQIESNVEWEILNDNAWLSATLEDSLNIEIEAEEYLVPEGSRTGNITFKQKKGSIATTVSIVQEGPKIVFSENPVIFGYEGGRKTILVNSNIFWSMYTYDIGSILPNYGQDGETEVTIDVPRTYYKFARTSDVIIKAGTGKDAPKISVAQIYQDASPSYDKEFTVTGNDKTVSFNMIFIKSGETLQWSDDEDDYDYWITLPEEERYAYSDKHRCEITLSKDYYLGETEVTQALWTAVMGSSNKWSQQFGLGDDYPAYNVSLGEIDTFLSKLNAMTGERFELPSEVEWEYAACDMADYHVNYSLWAGGSNVDDVAWYDENSKGICHQVKQLKATKMGIFDMSGNLREYCSDYYGPIKAGTFVDLIGKGQYRVVRGGSYYDNWQRCEYFERDHAENPDASEKGNRFTGFRLKLTAK